jgi:hypothetical protein
MTEVGGDAAIYVDPNDPESAAWKVADLLKAEPGPRFARREAGLFNVARFKASAMIDGYLALYRRLAEEGSSHGANEAIAVRLRKSAGRSAQSGQYLSERRGSA